MENLKVLVFDSTIVTNPTELVSVIEGGTHYSALVTNDSDSIIRVGGIPVYPQTQFVDEKPPVVLVDAFSFAKSCIAYDIPVECPDGTDLEKVIITRYYCAGVK